jgi:hypothetical protein
MAPKIANMTTHFGTSSFIPHLLMVWIPFRSNRNQVR